MNLNRYLMGIKRPLPPALIDKIIRVDHAGELCADRIYAGQMAVLGKTEIGPKINEMWQQEKHHLATFNKLLKKYRSRPTILLPIASQFGYLLGLSSAMISKEAAMACTVAVETVITDHYNDQIRDLLIVLNEKNKTNENSLETNRLIEDCSNDPNITEKDVKELLEYITQFRDDEQDHHDTGIENDAEKTPGYKALTTSIESACKFAVWISQKI
ncbi:hypothetical protein SNEBB_000489 [Seison nebaliae]|nr:hypothetical protein SNEBB_000489 [Seison nebaliae]